MTDSKIRNITIPLPYVNTGNFRFMGKVKAMFSEGVNVWLLDDRNRIVLYNTETKSVRKTLELNETVPDISFCQDTSSVWYCSQDSKTIGEIESGQKIVRFTADKQPLSLCVTAESNVVVGMTGAITLYTQEGSEVTCVTSHDNYTVRTPQYMAEFPATNNVSVIDSDWKSHGGKQRPRVVIFDKSLNVLHFYFGRRQFEDLRPNLDRIEEAFSPRGIFYNNDGDIFVSDFYNHAVLRLSGTGVYIGPHLLLFVTKPRTNCGHCTSMIGYLDTNIKICNGSTQIF